ncbi:hypothetical protein Tco_0456705 [Tanacetum coccineum]
MYTFSPMMVANSRKHHCRVRSYTREVLVISTNLDIQKNHYPLDFRNRRGDEARIKNTWYNQGYCRDHMIRGKIGFNKEEGYNRELIGFNKEEGYNGELITKVKETSSQFLVTTSKSSRDDVRILIDDVKRTDSEEARRIFTG